MDSKRKRRALRQKAQQIVIASYAPGAKDRVIDLLLSAVAIDPSTYNGYNALGYAYMAKGDRAATLAAFEEAINQHPDMKEGYFDMARAFLKFGDRSKCRQYLDMAIKVDNSSVEDIKNDDDLRGI